MGDHDRLEADIRVAAIEFLSGATGLTPPPAKYPIPPELRNAFAKLVSSLREAALEYANPGHMGMIERLADRLVRISLRVSGKKTASPPIEIPPYTVHGNSTVYEDPRSSSRPPHVKRMEALTSQPKNVHEIGKPLSVNILIDHQQPMKKACLSINVVNQLQAVVIHAWAFHPEVVFGSEPGETEIVCRFPALKLNPGRYHFRTHLTEPPGGEIYERLDNLCPFEIRPSSDQMAAIDKAVYREDNHWTVSAINDPAA